MIYARLFNCRLCVIDLYSIKREKATSLSFYSMSFKRQKLFITIQR